MKPLFCQYCGRPLKESDHYERGCDICLEGQKYLESLPKDERELIELMRQSRWL